MLATVVLSYYLKMLFFLLSFFLFTVSFFFFGQEPEYYQVGCVCVCVLDNENVILHGFFSYLIALIALTRGPHGRYEFAKCVLPSVNKVYYYYH